MAQILTGEPPKSTKHRAALLTLCSPCHTMAYPGSPLMQLLTHPVTYCASFLWLRKLWQRNLPAPM